MKNLKRLAVTAVTLSSVLVGIGQASATNTEDKTPEEKTEVTTDKTKPSIVESERIQTPIDGVTFSEGSCTLTITNGKSVHKDVNVIVKIGDNTYQVDNVEMSEGKISTLEGIEVGADDKVEVHVDRPANGNSSLEPSAISCEAPAAPIVVDEPTYTW